MIDHFPEHAQRGLGNEVVDGQAHASGNPALHPLQGFGKHIDVRLQRIENPRKPDPGRFNGAAILPQQVRILPPIEIVERMAFEETRQIFLAGNHMLPRGHESSAGLQHAADFRAQATEVAGMMQ